VKGINNTMAADISYTCDVEVFSRFDQFRVNVICAVVEVITGNLPSQHIDCSSWNIPDDVQLADPKFFESATADLLLGADYFFDVVSTETRSRHGYPTLLNTQIGWIVSGRFPAMPSKGSDNCLSTHFIRSDVLDTQLPTVLGV
jgi:hypothetical protein